MNSSGIRWKNIIIEIFILIGILILVFKPDPHSRTDKADQERLFYISGSGEQVGQLGQEKETVFYSLTMDNPGRQTYQIKSIHPILSEGARELLLEDQTLLIHDTKKLKPNKEISFFGQFLVNTSKLSEKQIQDLIPFVRAYRVIYDDGQEVVLNGITP